MSTRQADVAVVVPVFDRASTVLKTLYTVHRQSIAPRRLIIVDDGSSDGTASAVRRWIAETAPKYAAFVVEQANQGAGAARNRGYQESTGCEFVAFLDSDDHWPSDFLERTVARMKETPAAVGVSTDRLYRRRQKRRWARRSCRGLESNATRWLLTHNSGITSCSLFRSSVVERLGGFDVSILTGQDVEFFLRASLLGPWLHAPGDAVTFYVGFSSANGEMENLSAVYPDRQRRWLRIRERFVFEQGGLSRLPTKFYQRFFAKRWHKVGADYESAGRGDLAIVCYHKALSYRPMRIWTSLRLASAQAKRAVGAAFTSRRAPLPKTEADAENQIPPAKRLAA